MNNDHVACVANPCLCHLSDDARERFIELMRGGCPEQAEALLHRGIWS